ncbi:hypothetical protein PYCCODRAFT_1464766 [Trametes coccinea BRFM310]|uniref:Uncharacterized protein n=1 Tax=Trametes coccinea (strain BRFM310) TaxID=1353009 RepID=A0A1Y2IYE1_TRAC3|nr:hypothetical protein PYCCODRAFT_1464766 [Trametes coccinea BRFM310]
MVAQPSAPGAAFANLSNDVAIQLLLADIPNFSVGILAFGVLTFFFLMRRVDRWVFCLHVAVLLSFLAALFDLSQILIRGRQATDQGVDTAGVSGLITAREVFYALANGLRFLFYWGFVAVIPAGETIPEGTVMHSASWQRWGLLGTLLQWATLLLLVLSTILQLVYRNVSAFEKIGAVYEAEGTLEIILSAVFILKLLLNSWARFSTGSTMLPTSKVLAQYAPAMVALMFSFWIAVGNVILFEFTETALGRFLRAIEFYTMVIYMLTLSFHHLRHLSFFPIYRPATKGPSRAPTFQRDSIAKISDEKVAAAPVTMVEPVRVDLMQVLEGQYRQQEMPPTVMRDSSRAATVRNVSQHQSMAARLSTWLGIGRPLPRTPAEGQDVQPWDVDAERGPSPTQQEAPMQSWNIDERMRGESPPLPPPPVIDEDEQRGVSPIPEYAPKYEVSQRDVVSPVPSSIREYPAAPGIIEPSEGEPTPPPNRDWRDIEYSNAVRYSGVGEDVVANALSRQQYQGEDDSRLQTYNALSPIPSRPGSMDGEYLNSPYPMSPIGSAAVTPLPRSRPLPPMPRADSQLFSPTSPLAPDSARSSNISILRRRQTELDESIAALRLFSPSKMAFDVNTMPVAPAMFYTQLAQPTVQSEERPDTPPDMESPELPAPSPDLTLATPRADRLPQSSARSEFSFSNFEHQPPLNRGSMDSGVIPQRSIRSNVVDETDNGQDAERTESPLSTLEPPRMPAAMASRFSDSSSIADGRERKIDSVGTQYEITSFIGNLTVPQAQKDSTIFAVSAASSDESSANVAVATKADLRAAQYARPTLIPQPLSQNGLATDGLAVPPQPSPMPSPARTPGSRALPPIPRPSIRTQPQTSPQQPVTPSAPTPRFRRAVGLPPRPRLSAVNVELTPVDEKSSPTDTVSTLVSSPQRRSGTPVAGERQ